MEEAVIVDTMRVLPVSVDTERDDIAIVEPTAFNTDRELEPNVLPIKVENVRLVPCSVLTVSVERFVS